MSLKCANCGASIHLTNAERRKYGGKFFACPDCGASKRLSPCPQSHPAKLPLAVALVTVAILVAGAKLWPSKATTAVGGVVLPNVAGIANAAVPKDRELEAVRAWLRENSNSGQWDEVKWWPARKVKSQWVENENVNAGRLKFRSPNQAGAKTIHDVVFAFDQDNHVEWFIDFSTENLQTTRNDRLFLAAQDVYATMAADQ